MRILYETMTVNRRLKTVSTMYCLDHQETVCPFFVQSSFIHVSIVINAFGSNAFSDTSILRANFWWMDLFQWYTRRRSCILSVSIFRLWIQSTKWVHLIKLLLWHSAISIKESKTNQQDHFSPLDKGHKTCTAQGKWKVHNITRHPWTNYTSCVDILDLNVSIHSTHNTIANKQTF